jgi:hypothetical protein
MKVSKVYIRGKSVWIEGSEDGWNSKQIFCDVYEVSGYIVGLSAMNQKPMFVVEDRLELLGMLREKWPGATFE